MAPPIRFSFCFCLLLISLSKAYMPLSLPFKLFPNHNKPLQSDASVPKGILPDAVQSYALSHDGSFCVQLKTPCYVHFDRLVYYDTLITGKLSYGSVTDVTGIQAQKLFLWLPVTGIKADDQSGTVEFFVGPLSEQLPADQFQDIPSCNNHACARKAILPQVM